MSSRFVGVIFVVVGLGAPLASAADRQQFGDPRPDATAQVRLGGISAFAPDDPLAALSINDVTVTEGDAGSIAAIFTVSLDAPSSDPVSVDYATSDGTAHAPGDYQAAVGTLTIPAGETSGTLTVQVSGDVLDEADETYGVTLSNPINGTIADGSGVGTILDDDPPPSLSINDVAILEGNTGNNNATFTVSLSSAAGQTVTVQYATADGTAVAGSDYQFRTGTLTFEAGQTTRNFNVRVSGDTQVEPDETYFVNLSNPTNAVIADGQGLGTIINDDGPPPPPPPPPPPLHLHRRLRRRRHLLRRRHHHHHQLGRPSAGPPCTRRR